MLGETGALVKKLVSKQPAFSLIYMLSITEAWHRLAGDRMQKQATEFRTKDSTSFRKVECFSHMRKACGRRASLFTRYLGIQAREAN